MSPPAHRIRPPVQRDALALGVVALAFTTAQLLLVPGRLPPLWDESVYASQVDPHRIATSFLAHRARGIVALIWPVLHLTSSWAPVRLYLAVLTGGLLLLAHLPWLRLRRGAAVPLAALLSASLWVTLFYGPAVMPNLHVAYGGLGAAGCLLLCRRGDRLAAPLSGVAAGIGYAALMRPTDALLLGLPLAVAGALLLRGRVLVGLLAALAAGEVVGWLPWVVEAYARFGGPLSRLRETQRVTGSKGLTDLVPLHLQALHGALLCTTSGGHCGPLRPGATAFAVLAVPLAVVGVVAAGRSGRRATMLVPLVMALVFALPYLFTLFVVAPRFLLPVWLLLALPAAEGLCLLVGASSRRPVQLLAGSAVALAMVAQVVTQVRVTRTLVTILEPGLAGQERVASALNSRGIRGRCAIAGDLAEPIAYRADCYGEVRAHLEETTPPADVAARLAEHERIAVMVRQSRPVPAGSYVRAWRRLTLRTPGLHIDAYLSPPG